MASTTPLLASGDVEKQTSAIATDAPTQASNGTIVNVDDDQTPFLPTSTPPPPPPPPPPSADPNSPFSLVMKYTANLANLLPTGTVLAFQFLSPMFTNQGECSDSGTKIMTSILLVVCGLSCALLCFTDSFTDVNRNVRYGFATCSGLWVADGGPPLPPATAAQYKVTFLDFLHASMSVLVFAAVALLDKNVVGCFYPVPSPATRHILASLPAGIGVLCSLLFVAFPTTRHGIGFPVVAHK